MILHVVGARPNFMKAAPVWRALAAVGASQLLVHTGQHYDVNMSDIFFQQLDLPKPDFNLEVGSGSHAEQTGQIMQRIEPVIIQSKPRAVLVYGDVNSTIAAAIVCAKLLVPVAHVEAGLRSFDRTMPEEVNRILTDRIADILFTPSQDGNLHLASEGIPAERIFLVGNIMIDSLIRALGHARKPIDISGYVLVTLHRPSNVDQPAVLEPLLHALGKISLRAPVVFPVHPRTTQRIAGISGFNRANFPNLHLMSPQGYFEFLGLQKDAKVVVTDSGGVQEETTFLGIPCLTMRENTERPVTVEVGTNMLIGNNIPSLLTQVDLILAGKFKKGAIPPLWDGKTGDRIARILAEKNLF